MKQESEIVRKIDLKRDEEIKAINERKNEEIRKLNEKFKTVKLVNKTMAYFGIIICVSIISYFVILDIFNFISFICSSVKQKKATKSKLEAKAKKEKEKNIESRKEKLELLKRRMKIDETIDAMEINLYKSLLKSKCHSKN